MGGLGGLVDVDSASNILTQGEQSHGIMAKALAAAAETAG